ncbi:hypothetical protein FXV83_16420 [Bradyrhizobium hipponense]|uniref:Uncharacterized protein n=1 Tax=Bradyrhizobium hipponense TaxID=2605638 RepID=A0A5S4YQ64_9BRAD|nr:hypothetical protein [Bradyrhizobium hipponense]TYO65515.1 hypothetical protein FXV83_16420 [Bradyrhizobium hipponense]
MADLTLKLEASEYRCEPCTLRQGTVVRELVRMIPKSVVVFGKLVGPEYYCCPICYEPKFDAKTRKPVKNGVKSAAKSKRISVVK